MAIIIRIISQKEKKKKKKTQQQDTRATLHACTFYILPLPPPPWDVLIRNLFQSPGDKISNKILLLHDFQQIRCAGLHNGVISIFGTA